MADPTTVTGLIYRMRPTNLALGNGAAISSLPFLVGSATLVQATGGSQPLYIASGVNGQPTVRFDGVNDVMTAGSQTTRAQPLTVILVFKTAPAGRAQQPYHLGGGELSATAANLWGMWAGSANLNDGSVTSSATVHTCIYNGASSAYYVDGSLSASGSPGTSGIGATITVGDHATGGRSFGGDIYELLIYTAALNATDRSTVHTWVGDTYGIITSDYVTSYNPPTDIPTNIPVDPASGSQLVATKTGVYGPGYGG